MLFFDSDFMPVLGQDFTNPVCQCDRSSRQFCFDKLGA